MSNELHDHWTFIEPDSRLDLLHLEGDIFNSWMQLFYTARCLFSEQTEFPMKNQLAPLLERKEIFSNGIYKNKKGANEIPHSSIFAENFDLERITSISQISYILPREFVLYSEDLFYKKLLNRELLKKEFREPETFSVSEFVKGREQKLNQRQKVYILFDNSSSMNGERLNKLFAAKAICIEYLRKVQREGPQIYFRSFNQEISDLKRIDTAEGIKTLIRHIVELNTFDCFETKIAEAVMKAILDIKGDPAFRQAEIIMITDGLGDVPKNIKDHLGKIKFHLILISGMDINHYLKLFPDRDSLEKSDVINLSKEFSTGLEGYVNLKKVLNQIYDLREISDIFIRIPSLLGERFRFSNVSELALIREIRQSLEKRLQQGPSSREKYEIFQKVQYIIKYLQIMLSNAGSKEIKKAIKEELAYFNHLEGLLMEDEWFSYDLENKRAQIKRKKKKRKREPMVVRKMHQSWWAILWDYLKQAGAIQKHLFRGLHDIVYFTKSYISESYRRYILRRRFRYINKRLRSILNKKTNT
jgi:hypothetical protein